MLRLGLGFIAAVFIAGLCGCGGGGGDSSSGVTVAIQDFQVQGNPNDFRTRFFSKTATIQAGQNNGITWINQAPGLHQVVSGTLVPDGSPANLHTVVINMSFFTPNELNAEAGDTIQFSNLSGHTFNMQIANDNGAVVSDISFAIGEQRTVTFPGPGVWIASDAESQLVATITLYGRPVPDGQFMSGVLPHGGVFQRAFPVPGTYPYYDSNPDDPTHVYATGTIVVQ